MTTRAGALARAFVSIGLLAAIALAGQAGHRWV
jgi:hypothetical protein